ncbi:hypothetical protein Y883_11560, partial [Luteibacter rhizovicinus DSM 16549]
VPAAAGGAAVEAGVGAVAAGAAAVAAGGGVGVVAAVSLLPEPQAARPIRAAQSRGRRSRIGDSFSNLLNENGPEGARSIFQL